MSMFGGGTWPPEGIERCPICDREVHPGQCSGGVLAPEHRTIDEPIPGPPVLAVVPDPRSDAAPVPGRRRTRHGLIEDRSREGADENRRAQ